MESEKYFSHPTVSIRRQLQRLQIPLCKAWLHKSTEVMLVEKFRSGQGAALNCVSSKASFANGFQPPGVCKLDGMPINLDKAVLFELAQQS